MANPQGLPMLFVEFFEREAIGNKNGFKILKLHDPSTLQNADFFLNESHGLDLMAIRTLKLRDPLLVEFGMGIMQGKALMIPKAIHKVS